MQVPWGVSSQRKQLQSPCLTWASKLCVTDAEGCVWAQAAAMQCSQTKLSEMDRHSSQKFTIPSLGLEFPFSCFGDKFWSQGTSLLCFQALWCEAECSVPWPGCAISQPVLGCTIETFTEDFFPFSSNHTHLFSCPVGLCCFLLPGKMLMLSWLILSAHKTWPSSCNHWKHSALVCLRNWKSTEIFWEVSVLS